MRSAVLAAIAGAVVVTSPVALCGPATAVVHAGGKTYTFTHGFCATFPTGSFQLSLGTALPMGNGNDGKPYFSVDVGKGAPRAGGFAYYGGKKTITVGGTWAVTGTITSHASFTGSSATGAFSGTWNCHGLVVKE